MPSCEHTRARGTSGICFPCWRDRKRRDELLVVATLCFGVGVIVGAVVNTVLR